MADGLNPKQEAFVAYYLGEANKNATKAATLAGYKQPMQQGHALLRKPEIQATIEAWRADIKKLAITSMEERLAVLDTLKAKYLQVIDERSEIYGKDNAAPGTSTGLLVRQERVIGSGESAQHIIEYRVDTAVTDAIQNLDAQAAKELGQWTDKQQITGEIGVRRYIGVDPDAV